MSLNPNIVFRRNNDENLFDNCYRVKVIKYGDYMDLIALEPKEPRKPNCKKTDDGCYVNTVTGQFLTVKKSDNRSENLAILRKSAKQLYQLIHANFIDNIGYHAVLTYSIPQRDTKEVYHDFKIYWQKLRYKYPDLAYIAVLEPTEKGVWHLHVLLKKVNNPYKFISYQFVRENWSHGFVYISKMRKEVDYGNYFRKKINKSNELLKLYKPGIRYFRHSRNIRKPLTYKTDVWTAEKMIDLGNYKTINQYSLDVNEINNDGGESTLNKVYYKFLKNERK